MEFSIIIPVYLSANRSIQTLENCLFKLRECEQGSEGELILIDDGSHLGDRLVRLCLQYGALYNRMPYNQGPGAARNRGAEISRGKILLFIDSDCSPSKSWIRHLILPIQNGKSDATTATYCGPLNKTWLTEYQDIDFEYRMPRKQCYVDFLHGCSCAIKREIFLKPLNFPNTRLFEDQLLGRKLYDLGYKILYVPEAGVMHAYRQTVREYLTQQYKFGFGIFSSYLSNAALKKKRFESMKKLPKVFENKEVVAKNYLRVIASTCLNFILMGLVFLYLIQPTQHWVVYAGGASFFASIIIHGPFLYFIYKKKNSRLKGIFYLPLILCLHWVYVLAICKSVFWHIWRFKSRASILE